MTQRGKILKNSTISPRGCDMPSCYDPCDAHDRKLNNSYNMLTWNHLYDAAKRLHKHPEFQIFYEKAMMTAKDDPSFIDELFALAMKLDRSEYNKLMMKRGNVSEK